MLDVNSINIDKYKQVKNIYIYIYTLNIWWDRWIYNFILYMSYLGLVWGSEYIIIMTRIFQMMNILIMSNIKNKTTSGICMRISCTIIHGFSLPRWKTHRLQCVLGFNGDFMGYVLWYTIINVIVASRDSRMGDMGDRIIADSPIGSKLDEHKWNVIPFVTKYNDI